MTFFGNKMNNTLKKVTKIQKGHVQVHNSVHERYRPDVFIRSVKGKLIKVEKEVDAIKIEPDSFQVDDPYVTHLYPEKRGRPNRSKLPSLIQVLDDSSDEEEEKKAI